MNDLDPNVPYVPRSIDPDLLAKLPQASSPVPLTGTPKQIKWAETIRAKLIALAPVALVDVLNAVADSTWWIRNQRREYVDFNWDYLLPKTDRPAPAATAATLALAENAESAASTPKPKLGWKKIDDRLYVAPLFSWQVIQVFRHGLVLAAGAGRRSAPSVPARSSPRRTPRSPSKNSSALNSPKPSPAYEHNPRSRRKAGRAGVLRVREVHAGQPI